jgi:hypothetical protein
MLNSSCLFEIDTLTGFSSRGYTSNFPVDMAIRKTVDSTSQHELHTRLTQGKVLYPQATASEGNAPSAVFDDMLGYYDASSVSTDADKYAFMFRRQKSFFDVVTYTGNGVAGRTVNHNLGVVPEMIWVKARTITTGWNVYHIAPGNTIRLLLDSTDDSLVSSITWNNTSPTSTDFTTGISNQVNATDTDYIAYLFATLPSVSKVGSYTGNGTTQTIDAGFTTGAKFLIVKRYDVVSAGDWIMVDSVRGLDNFLELNTTNAQASGSGITVDASGFNVTQNGTTDLNASGGEYIYYAIAEGV